jgi:hypothetical protein
MDRVLETALGCIFALGCWKASKENWLVAYIGVALLAWVLKFAGNVPFPLSLLVYLGAFGVMASINPLWERMKKYSAEIEAKKAASNQQN